MSKKNDNGFTLDRRSFMTAMGAGMAFAGTSMASAVKSGGDLNVAIIGTGAQGRILIDSCIRIPGIRFRAVCDIWSWSQRFGSGRLRSNGHKVNVYEDYREMLDKEKDLDAVIVATPDWMHAEHANACMEAGLHVYSEKEMSNSLEKAKSMVETSHRTDKLLQIGHQRRSNPRYIHAIDNLVHKERLLGRVTQANAQWNRAKSEDLGVPKGQEMDAETLAKYGYDSMSQFRNWRWYRKYGGGPIVDLGSHQIDIFSWVFGTTPNSVMAAGGVDFYHQHDWYDNVMCVFDFENEFGVSRAFYQVLTTTSYGGFKEAFMGEDGTLEISEVPAIGNAVASEIQATNDNPAKWDELVRRGWLREFGAPMQSGTTKNVKQDSRVSPPLPKWPLPIELSKPAHQPHLENFFDAIRLGKPLNCPAELGYETAVMVLRVNDAVEAGRTLHFAEEDFKV